jgi:hypothetical protein
VVRGKPRRGVGERLPAGRDTGGDTGSDRTDQPRSHRGAGAELVGDSAQLRGADEIALSIAAQREVHVGM